MIKEVVVAAFEADVAKDIPGFSAYSNGYRWLDMISTLTVYLSRKPPFALPHFFRVKNKIITIQAEINSLIR